MPENLLDPHLPSVRTIGGDISAALGERAGRDTLLVLPVAPDFPGTRAALDALGLAGADLLATHQPSTTAGATTTIPLLPGSHAVRTVLLVGLGASDPSLTDLRAAGAAAGRAGRGRATVVLAVPAAARTEEAIAAFVEGTVLGGWAPPRWTDEGVAPGTAVAGEVRVVAPTDADPVVADAVGDAVADAVAKAVLRARATIIARCLTVTPSNLKNPAWFAGRARAAARRSGLTTTVWSERDLRREGFGGLLAVGGGSATGPRLVRLDFRPSGAGAGVGSAPVALVGKGITFDSGGLDIKPAGGMLAMKTDMAGAAVVLAVLQACRDLDVRVPVIGLMPLAENAVSGSSYRPGDVVTHYGGRTTEIANTDAEGRMVLADALAYAAAELDPRAVVDIATLTGAARVALARWAAPIFATDQRLREELVAAGSTTGETLWPLPMPAAYRRDLDSEVADIRQVSTTRTAGSIMAAMFLREFAGTQPWAHLDVAGPGRSDVDTGILGKGGTGFGTRLLLRWLQTLT